MSAIAHNGLPPGPRKLASLVAAGATVMAVLDSVVIAVGLPSIAQQLQIGPAGAVLIISAFQLAASAVLLPVGRLADCYGHKKVYLGCLALFMVGSVTCAMTSALPLLVVARLIQGCGGAGLMGLTNAILRRVYPTETLARGLSLNSTVVGVALASGPSLAALILSFASWRWLFIINVPIGAIILLAGFRWLPTDEPGAGKLDWPAAVLNAATFALLMTALTALAHDWPAIVTGPCAIGAVVAGIALVRHQRAQEAPILPLDVLKLPLLRFSVLTHFAAAATQIMAYVTIPFVLLRAGWNQAEIGFIFTAWPIAIMMISPAAGFLAGRFKFSLLASAGLIVLALGLVLMTFLPLQPPLWLVVADVFLCGLGYGFFQIPNTRALLTSVPYARSSAASVLGAQGRVLGQALGAVLVAFALQAPPDQATNLSLWLAAGLAVFAVLTSGARLKVGSG